MEEEWLNLRRLWPQYGLVVWRRCNRFESFIPSFFFIAKENHDYLKHVLLVVYCARIRLQAIPQVTFAQSHPMPRWVLLLLLLLLLLSLIPGFYPSLWIVHWHPSNCSLVPFGLCSEPPNVKVGVVVVVVFFGFTPLFELFTAPFDLCSEQPNAKVGGLSFAKYFSKLLEISIL